MRQMLTLGRLRSEVLSPPSINCLNDHEVFRFRKHRMRPQDSHAGKPTESSLGSLGLQRGIRVAESSLTRKLKIEGFP